MTTRRLAPARPALNESDYPEAENLMQYLASDASETADPAAGLRAWRSAGDSQQD